MVETLSDSYSILKRNRDAFGLPSDTKGILVSFRIPVGYWLAVWLPESFPIAGGYWIAFWLRIATRYLTGIRLPAGSAITNAGPETVPASGAGDDCREGELRRHDVAMSGAKAPV